MEFRHKIVAMVSVQVAIIVASFVTIVHFESQTAMAGNIVNVAGKNRALAITVQAEMHEMLLRGDLGEEGGGAGRAGVDEALENLEENILFLKRGGSMDGIAIAPLADRFESEWLALRGKLAEYRGKVAALAAPAAEPTDGAMASLDRTSSEMVAISDTLAGRLGEDVDALSMNLVRLQTALGLGNVALHLLMITLILRVTSRHTEQAVRAERLAAVGELASTVAHDMKNPLATIMNAATIIRGSAGGGGGAASAGRLASALDMLDRSVLRMSHQIDGVLSHAKALPLTLESESVGGMLGRALRSMNVPDNVSIRLPDGDASVSCDSAKMEFVFSNILLNAVQAMGGDGGRIDVRLERDGDGGIALSFANSGPPIPEEHIDRVFEPLVSTKMNGTGLGLTSCRNVVAQHGGSIGARNDPVTFTVRLPRRPAGGGG